MTELKLNSTITTEQMKLPQDKRNLTEDKFLDFGKKDKCN